MMNRSKPFQYLLIALLFTLLAGCSQELSEEKETPAAAEPAALPAIMTDSGATNSAEPELSTTAEDIGGDSPCDSEFIFAANSRNFQIGACDNLDSTFTLRDGSGNQVFNGSYSRLIDYCAREKQQCVDSLRATIDRYQQEIEDSDLGSECLARVGRQSRDLLADNDPRRLRFLAVGATTLAVVGVGSWGIKYVPSDAGKLAVTLANIVVLTIGYEQAIKAGKINLRDLSAEGYAAGMAGFSTLTNYAKNVFRARRNQPQLLPITCPSKGDIRFYMNNGPYRKNGELRR